MTFEELANIEPGLIGLLHEAQQIKLLRVISRETRDHAWYGDGQKLRHWNAGE